MSTAPPRADADPIEAVVAFLDDARAVLDELARAPRLSAADLPDIRAALEAAIYDSPAGDCEPCANHGGEGLCIQHASRAALIPRWTALLHRLNGAAESRLAYSQPCRGHTADAVSAAPCRASRREAHPHAV